MIMDKIDEFKEEKAKILEVKNLRISFRTVNGTVKAVRGVSFSLYRGKTLAIVGESGSGKSVTSRAIMGILAPNKIVEEGQILYDGKDLLKLSEEDFTKIRGSKISMIFQDPMSSLNPIMKVGKQVTEAMVLKSKATIKYAKKSKKMLFNALIKENSIAPVEGFSVSALEKDYLASVLKNTDFRTFNIHELALSLIRDNFTTIRENRENAISVLKKAKEDITKDNLINMKVFKFYSKNIKSCLTKSENILLANRDNSISTFYVLLKYSISEYYAAVEREKKDNKEKVKFDNLDEKAKIQKKAFGSEINYSHEDVYKNICDSFDSIIKYLSESLLEPNPVTSDSFFKYFNRVVVDASKSVDKKEIYNNAVSVLGEVGIPQPEKRMKQYPFQFSGGMRQRIVIAIALSSNPEVLICDEPTTALDVTIQAQILDLINDLKEKRNLSVIFITHNLGVVAKMADDIAVMYAGKIVEYGTAEEIYYSPVHPYTWALLSSMPDLNSKDKLEAIPGTPPNMIIPPVGDAFAARNKYAMKIDFEKEPPLFQISPTHFAATWLLHPSAPKVLPPKVVTDRIKFMQAHFMKQEEKGAKNNDK